MCCDVVFVSFSSHLLDVSTTLSTGFFEEKKIVHLFHCHFDFALTFALIHQFEEKKTQTSYAASRVDR